MWPDVSVYFRSELEVRDVELITHGVLQEFPCRILPEFKPWYPSTSDTNKAIKPKNPPPLISSEDLKSVTCCVEEHQDTSDVRNKNRAEDIRRAKSLSGPETGSRAKGPFESKQQEFRRSWCVITDRTRPMNSPRSFSRQFQKTIEKHRLHLHQRVKWVVCEQNCVAHAVEEVWLQLNRAIRHSRLPTCNANFQRQLAQIWVYCDAFYCEFIGNFLKQEFKLLGQITLTVHKLGDIIKL